MLPPVVFQNKVLITLLGEAVLKFRRNVWHGIHIVLDRPFLANERLKLGFPILHQGADFHKVTLRRRFHEGRIHSVT